MARRTPPAQVDAEASGPARFFGRHRGLFALSLALAGTAAGIFAARSVRSRGAVRVGWALLAAMQGGIMAGMLGLDQDRRRRIQAFYRRAAALARR